VGNNGETLVADSSATTGLSYQANWAAGKNKIINGDMRFWQRGTSFTVATSSSAYTADRMLCVNESGANATFSQQTFTAGTAPVSGYEGTFFLRGVTTGTSGATYITQRIEDVRAFAGQTVTVSYWAKCASGTVSSTGYYLQNFGSGGSSSVFATLSSATITTSWQRFTHTIAIPSIASKTIGTSSYLEFQILRYTAAATVDLWGVQVEAGSVATAFQTATGTIQGELAACQRYYYRFTNTTANPSYLGIGTYYSTTTCYIVLQWPVTMRIAPTIATSSQTGWLTQAGTQRNSTAFAVDVASTGYADVYVTTSSHTLGIGAVVGLLGSSNHWVEASAEL
jgi:hypothetical protein